MTEPASTPPPWRRLPDGVAASVLVAAVVHSFVPVLQDPLHLVVGVRNQQWVEGVMWWYWNVATALFHGKSPLANDWHGFPLGYRHIDIVGNLGDSVLAAPTSWFADPPLSYTCALVGFTLFTAFAGYGCFRAWTGSRVAAVALALVFLWQPQLHLYLYEGRPTQLVYGWSLLALWGARELVDEGGRRARWMTAIGWTGAFVSFWFNGIFLGFLLLGTLVGRRRPGLARDVGWVVGATVLGALPWGLPLLGSAAQGSTVLGFHLGQLPPMGHMSSFSARPWEFLLPSDAYGTTLPWTLAAALPVAFVVRGGRPGRGLLVGLVILWTLSWGPRLVLQPPTPSHPSESVLLPWAWLYAVVPFWYRLSYPYMVFPYVLAGVAMWTGRLRWAPLVAALALGETVVRFPTQVPVAAFSIPDFYRQLGARTDVHALMEFPLGRGDYRHVYQVAHQKPMLDVRGDLRAMFFAPGLLELYETTPFLRALYAWQTGERALVLDDAARGSITRLGIDYLVLSREGVDAAQGRLRQVGWDRVRATLIEALGQPDAEADGLVGFRLTGDPSRAPTPPVRDAIPGVSTVPRASGPVR